MTPEPGEPGEPGEEGQPGPTEGSGAGGAGGIGGAGGAGGGPGKRGQKGARGAEGRRGPRGGVDLYQLAAYVLIVVVAVLGFVTIQRQGERGDRELCKSQRGARTILSDTLADQRDFIAELATTPDARRFVELLDRNVDELDAPIPCEE